MLIQTYGDVPSCRVPVPPHHSHFTKSGAPEGLRRLSPVSLKKEVAASTRSRSGLVSVTGDWG